MRVTEDKDFLNSLFPEMMKKTKLLILDHDVTRYHSFDLLRYQLFRDTQMNGFAHFSSMRPEYHALLNSRQELAEQVRFMQNHVRYFNIYECFSDNMGIVDKTAYTVKIREMLRDPIAKITPTDISTRFDVVFNRKTIDGFILQYKDETNHPSCFETMASYTTENILDLSDAVVIIQQNMINAVMLCSTELAVRLATRLYTCGYTTPITFIIGRYAYNFICDEKSNRLYPSMNREMGELEVNLKHEFGFFDPFSGLTYRAKCAQVMEEELTQNG